MSFLNVLSPLILPLLTAVILFYGIFQKIDLYAAFLEGAKTGLQTVLDILPTLIGLILAVEVMKAGGLLDVLTALFRPLAEALGFPAELVPLSLVRLVSSSAAVGLLKDIFSEFGPDSFLGRTASVMLSCTETVFYTMSLYFLSVGVEKTRWTLPAALLSALSGILASLFLTKLVF